METECIRPQMSTRRKPGEPPASEIIGWVEEAAVRLGDRLRLGQVPRARRQAARRLLTEAFEGIEAGAVGLELARRLDAAATPPGPRIGLRQRIGVQARLAVIDPRLVGRLVDRWLWAEAQEARIQRFIDGLGDEVLARLARLPTLREGRYPEVGLDLTEG